MVSCSTSEQGPELWSGRKRQFTKSLWFHSLNSRPSLFAWQLTSKKCREPLNDKSSMAWGAGSCVPWKADRRLEILARKEKGIERLLGAFEILGWGNFILLSWSAPVQEDSLEEFTDAKVTSQWPLTACQARSEPSLLSAFIPSWLVFLFTPCFLSSAQDGAGGHHGDLRLLEAPRAHPHFWGFHHHAEAARWADKETAKTCRKGRRRGQKQQCTLLCVQQLEWGCHTHCWALGWSERTQSTEGDGNSRQAMPYGFPGLSRARALWVRRRSRKDFRVGQTSSRTQHELNVKRAEKDWGNAQPCQTPCSPFTFTICVQTHGEGGVDCPQEGLGDQGCVPLWGHAILISKHSGLAGDTFC